MQSGGSSGEPSLMHYFPMVLKIYKQCKKNSPAFNIKKRNKGKEVVRCNRGQIYILFGVQKQLMYGMFSDLPEIVE